MNDLYTNRRLIPKRAIIVYEGGKKYDPEYYLESREIENKNGKYNLMTPAPLANEVMKSLAMSYTKSSSLDISFDGFLDEHLLYGTNKLGTTVVMWYRPAMIRSLNFSSALNIKGSVNSNLQIPATLYLVIESKLYVFALMTDNRPELKTKLYNAPFFNIYSSGNVCMGTAHLGRNKARTFDKEAERFERAFFMAEQNGGNSNNSCKTNLVTLWRQLIKTKAPFPSKEELIQHKENKTVGHLISKLIGNN